MQNYSLGIVATVVEVGAHGVLHGGARPPGGGRGAVVGVVGGPGGRGALGGRVLRLLGAPLVRGRHQVPGGRPGVAGGVPRGQGVAQPGLELAPWWPGGSW